MSLDKYRNDTRAQGLLAAVLIIVMICTAGIFMSVTLIPITDYGSIHIYNEDTNTELFAGDTVDVTSGDTLVVWLRDDVSTSKKPTDLLMLTASLYKADTNTLIEVGAETSGVYGHLVVTSFRWWFSLAQCPEGTFDYYVRFSANMGAGADYSAIRGDSFTFTISNSEPATYANPTILEEPTVVDFDIDQLVTITWTFDYDGPCEASVSSGSNVLQSLYYTVSTGERTFNYLVDTSAIGTQELIFTVNPDTEGISSVSSDPVTITIGEVTTTTTTTSTSTTTTTTTTTTTPTTSTAIVDYSAIIIGAIFFIVLAICGTIIIYVLVLSKRKTSVTKNK